MPVVWNEPASLGRGHQQGVTSINIRKIGGSYVGMTQWQKAAQPPPHLAAGVLIDGIGHRRLHPALAWSGAMVVAVNVITYLAQTTE